MRLGFAASGRRARPADCPTERVLIVRLHRLLAVLFSAALLLGACGGDTDDIVGEDPTTTAADGDEQAAGGGDAGSDDAADAAEPYFALPTNTGDFGSVTIGDVTWFAEARGCYESHAGAASTIAYLIVNEQSRAEAYLVVRQESGPVLLTIFEKPYDGQARYEGVATLESGEAEREYGEGKFNTGEPFSVGIIMLGAERCDA